MASNPQIPARCTSFELGTADHQIFETLQSGHSKFTKAMKLFAQRKQMEDDEEEWYGVKSIQFNFTSFSSSIVHPLCVFYFASSLVVLGERNLIFWRFLRIFRRLDRSSGHRPGESYRRSASGHGWVKNGPKSSGHEPPDFGHISSNIYRDNQGSCLHTLTAVWRKVSMSGAYVYEPGSGTAPHFLNLYLSFAPPWDTN